MVVAGGRILFYFDLCLVLFKICLVLVVIGWLAAVAVILLMIELEKPSSMFGSPEEISRNEGF